MSVAIDIFERMFEYEKMPSTAAVTTLTSATSRAASSAEKVIELQSRIRQMQSTKLDSRSIPTHPVIARLLPGGGLQEGSIYSVTGSATLLMALLAGPSAAGSW
jgi:hypothetical protein